MGKWETWDVKLCCVCKCICLYIYLWLLGVGSPAVCERDGNWGEVCEGAVSICFAYICRGGRRSMVDRWAGSARMTHGRSCSLLLYQHSYAQRSALLWRHTRKQKTEHSGPSAIAPRDTADTTRAFSVSWFEYFDWFVFKSAVFQLNFPWSRKACKKPLK